jgi:hypothetical protein
VRALADAENQFEAANSLSWVGAQHLVSDGGSFAFKTVNGAAWNAWRVTPSTWAGAACSAPASAERLGLSGQVVAWVRQPTSEYFLDYVGIGGSCPGLPDSISLGSPAFTTKAVGVANGKALAATRLTGAAPQKIDLALYDLATGDLAATPLLDQNVLDGAFAIVMGGLEYALLLTSADPLLVQL